MPAQGARLVSAVDLLVAPEKHEGVVVSVKGYLSGDSGSLFLYLTRDHAEMEDIVSAIIVADFFEMGASQSDCLDKYVEVVGRFERDRGVVYAINRVERISLVTPRRELCWARKGD